jgi:hypothetical protein
MYANRKHFSVHGKQNRSRSDDCNLKQIKNYYYYLLRFPFVNGSAFKIIVTVVNLYIYCELQKLRLPIFRKKTSSFFANYECTYQFRIVSKRFQEQITFSYFASVSFNSRYKNLLLSMF